MEKLSLLKKMLSPEDLKLFLDQIGHENRHHHEKYKKLS
jgi:hypothetical protein